MRVALGTRRAEAAGGGGPGTCSPEAQFCISTSVVAAQVHTAVRTHRTVPWLTEGKADCS